MSGTKARKAVRKCKSGPCGPFTRASALSVELLERLGLRWVLDTLAGSAAAGIVVGRYGVDAAQSQLRFYQDAGRAVLEAERRVTSSLAKGEFLQLLEWLADAVAARIASINSFLGLASSADFDHIAERLSSLDHRLAELERKRAQQPRRRRAAARSGIAPSEAAEPVVPQSRQVSDPILDLPTTVVAKTAAADRPTQRDLQPPRKSTESEDSPLVSDRIATALEAALKKSPSSRTDEAVAKSVSSDAAVAKPPVKKAKAKSKRVAKPSRAHFKAPTQTQTPQPAETAVQRDEIRSSKSDAVSSVRVDRRPVVDTAGTMFIGSVPSRDTIEPPLERASSISSKPDAMSAYLAKNPASGSKEGKRGRRRRTPPSS
jgi:hypothetical protein